MSRLALKFLEVIGVPVPVRTPIAAGDKIEDSLSKLQGQINAGFPVTLTSDTAFSNTSATVATYTITANDLEAGNSFEFYASGSIINAAGPSNLTVEILLNGSSISSAVLALGPIANASPGRGFTSNGHLTFRSVGASGTAISNMLLGVNAVSSTQSNITSVTSVDTTTTVTLAIRVSTNDSSSTGNIRQARIRRIL